MSLYYSQRLGSLLLLLVGLAHPAHPEPAEPLQVAVLAHLQQVLVEHLLELGVGREGERVARHGGPGAHLQQAALL